MHCDAYKWHLIDVDLELSHNPITRSHTSFWHLADVLLVILEEKYSDTIFFEKHMAAAE